MRFVFELERAIRQLAIAVAEKGIDRSGINHFPKRNLFFEKEIPFKEMIYTGPVDAFFGYCYGKLPYRSLEFKHETHNVARFQSAPVINYPNEQLYTRVTEFKYLTGQDHAKTSIVYEFPRSEGDAYYPIPRKENAALYARYKALADRTPGIHFVGRLAK